MRSFRIAWLAPVVVLSIAAPCLGQPPADSSEAEQVEMDPMRCWWRSEKAAVRVGEQFGLVLTCSVVETSTIRVVAQTAELEPAAIALIPFEVVGGETFEGFNDGPWRYFQFEYRLRLLAEDLFGEEVEIPSIPVTYNIQSMAGGGAEGMDQTYLLPALPIRVLSLVPEKADDIRDSLRGTFGDMEARRFRASLTQTIAWVAFGFAAVLFLLGALRGVGHFRSRTPVVRTASIGRILSKCAGEMSALRATSRSEGWSAELLARALSVFRVAGAVALDRPIAHTVVDRDVQAEDGQLLVEAGLLRTRRVLVSASTTPLNIGKGLDMRGRERVAVILEEVRDALSDLGGARYARDSELNELDLDRQRVGKHEWPLGQRVGTDRRQHHRGHVRVEQRPAGRKVVGGRARGRRDDQPVGAVARHELRLDARLELDHAAEFAAAREHDLVQHQVARALGLDGEARALVHGVVAAQDRRQRRLRGVGRHVGQEPEMAEVDRDDRHVAFADRARHRQHGAVSAQRNQQVAARGHVFERRALDPGGVLAGLRVEQHVERALLQDPEDPVQQRGHLALAALQHHPHALPRSHRGRA